VRLFVFRRSVFIFNFSVHSTFWLIIYPFSNKKLILLRKIIRSLTFSLVINPMTLKMISISLCKNSVPVSFTFMPLAFIDVFICIDHSPFSLRVSHYPKSIISISVRAEQCSSTMSLIFYPITCVFSLQLPSIAFPISSLTMSLVLFPHSFIFISIFVNLNSKSLLHVFFPISNVLC